MTIPETAAVTTPQRRVSEEELQALLKSYATARNQQEISAAFEALVAANLDYVKGIVAQITNTVEHLADFDDLVQYGVMGLISAIRLYKVDAPNRPRFTTYAYPRIRGAVQDAIRALSPTSRTRNVHYTPLQDHHTAKLSDPSWDELSHSLIPTGVTDALKEAMRELPLRQAMILLLAIHNVQLTSISHILNISYTRVLQERQRALIALRTRLEDEIGHQRDSWE